MITLKQLPTSVKLFVERCDAFIVGSAANPNAHLNEPDAVATNPYTGICVNDIDVVIPFHKWDIACIIIASANDQEQNWPTLNVYGGLKFVDDGKTVDVWPSDLNKYLLSSLVEYVWSPKFNLRYVRCVTGESQ